MSRPPAARPRQFIRCYLCKKQYKLLDAVATLRQDDEGFFCLCGGDVYSGSEGGAEKAALRAEFESLSFLFNLYNACSTEGDVPPAEASPKKVPRVKKRKRVKPPSKKPKKKSKKESRDRS